MRVRIPVKRRSYGRLNFHRHRFDWDAQVYFNRIQSAAGIDLSLDDRTNVSAFCKGLKKLGYWNALVEGWTLRSGQNAGSGVTAYGLRGVKDGTLFGAPAWGTTGITIDVFTKGITLSGLNFSGASWTLVLIFDYLGADATRSLFGPAGTVAGQPNSIKVFGAITEPALQKHVAGIGTDVVTHTQGGVAGFGYVAASRNNTDWYLEQNAVSNFGSDAIALAASADYNIGNQFSDSRLPADAVFAHVLLFNFPVDLFGNPPSINLAALIPLLRTTISQGLGL